MVRVVLALELGSSWRFPLVRNGSRGEIPVIAAGDDQLVVALLDLS